MPTDASYPHPALEYMRSLRFQGAEPEVLVPALQAAHQQARGLEERAECQLCWAEIALWRRHDFVEARRRIDIALGHAADAREFEPVANSLMVRAYCLRAEIYRRCRDREGAAVVLRKAGSTAGSLATAGIHEPMARVELGRGRASFGWWDVEEDDAYYEAAEAFAAAARLAHAGDCDANLSAFALLHRSIGMLCIHERHAANESLAGLDELLDGGLMHPVLHQSRAALRAILVTRDPWRAAAHTARLMQILAI